MSGVYIKGMKMPASCSDCPMCYDMMECTVGMPRIGFWKNEMKAEPFDFCTERHPRCPLIPIPDHGRLIDADTLFDFILNIYKNAQGEARKAYSDVLDVIVATGDVVPSDPADKEG